MACYTRIACWYIAWLTCNMIDWLHVNILNSGFSSRQYSDIGMFASVEDLNVIIYTTVNCPSTCKAHFNFMCVSNYYRPERSPILYHWNNYTICSYILGVNVFGLWNHNFWRNILHTESNNGGKRSRIFSRISLPSSWDGNVTPTATSYHLLTKAERFCQKFGNFFHHYLTLCVECFVRKKNVVILYDD